MTRPRAVPAAILISLAASVAGAQDHPHPQGEQLGTIRFPISCSAAVAPRFDRAVALLHSFEFGASIRAFNDVLAADSTCAMAHWGIALSRWSNPMSVGARSPDQLRQGKASADAAARLGATASERERAYIAAVASLYEDSDRTDQASRVAAYERAMKDVAARYPDDLEASIFHAISLVATAAPTDKTYAKQLEAGRLLEQLWEKQPDHPGLAHYIIHSYDYPALADKAREAARRYSRIAPSAAHALHMPSHTFTRVGMWEESVNTNIRSRDAALATGSIAEALHAADYMMYAYLQLGQEAKARAVLDGLPALAAGFDPGAITGAAPGSAGVFALAAIPARWVLERRAWAEAAALEPKASAFPYAEAMTYFARALGASRTGDLPRAKAARDSLGAIHQRLIQREPYWAEQVAIQHITAKAWIDLAEGRRSDALRGMREAVARESATEKSPVTPGPLAPAQELLADMLVDVGQRDAAVAEYRAVLNREPGRRHTIQALEALKPGR